MIITPATLTALMTGFNQSFEKGKSQAASQYSKIATVIKSTSKSNTYGWLGKWPKFREWIGERVINDMTASAYSVVNKPFESTIGVDRDDIKDDEIGVYAPMFEEMGRASAVFPDELLFPMLDAGTSSLCYDGQNFFDTDHPVYANHDGTGAVTSVSNFDNNGGNPQTKWYLLDTSRALKPLIYQDREPMQFIAMTKLDDEAVFTAKQFRYGVDCRANGGYGFWQMAYCSTKPLTAANIWAAIEAMRGFNADGGKPLGIKPNMLVVRGTQQQAALEAMKQTINGDTNTLAGQLEVLVADYL